MDNFHIETVVAQSLEDHSRLGFAVNALDAVRDLCCEAANGQPDAGLAHVNADHFASLLGLILGEMRSAYDAGAVAKLPMDAIGSAGRARQSRAKAAQ